MLINKVTSIKQLHDQGGSLNESNLTEIRNNVLSSMRIPSFKPIGSTVLTTGSQFSMATNDLYLPTLDFFTGEVSYDKRKETDPPVVVTFPGADSPILSNAEFDSGEGTLSVEVPDNALDGVLNILFPAVESFGTFDILKAVDCHGELYLRQFGRLIHPHTSENLCECDSPEEEPLLTKEYSEELLENLTRTTYYCVETNWTLQIRCKICRVQFPNDALEFSSTEGCSINPDKCTGQRYQTDRTNLILVNGREIFGRMNEESCWECFDGDEQYSFQCGPRKLKRVLDHNGICCGNCHPMSRIIGLNLMELCPHEAISQDGPYIVDKTKCEGCMICYQNINCFNNVEVYPTDETNDEINYTIRMVAHIDQERSQKWQICKEAGSLQLPV